MEKVGAYEAKTHLPKLLERVGRGERIALSSTTRWLWPGALKTKAMQIQSKKSFAMIDYDRCSPRVCDPEKGICPAVSACEHKVLKQIDGPFEPPMVFMDLCMGCWDCLEACPLEAVYRKHVT